MKYGSTCMVMDDVSTDYVIHERKLESCIQEKLDQSSLNKSDWTICYCPIIFERKKRGFFSVLFTRKDDFFRSDFYASSRKKELNCSPEIDYVKFKTGDGSTKQVLLVEGLRNISELMKETNFRTEDINEFKNIYDELLMLASDGKL